MKASMPAMEAVMEAMEACMEAVKASTEAFMNFYAKTSSAGDRVFFLMKRDGYPPGNMPIKRLVLYVYRLPLSVSPICY